MRNISILRKSDRGQETILLKFSIVGEVWFNDSLFLIIDPNIAQLEYGTDSERLHQENAYYKVFGKIDIDQKEYSLVKPKDTLKNSVLSPQELLSERELQIVELVAQGQSNKQIAKKLKISEWTVSTHLRRVFAKLKVDSRAAMVYHCASLVRYRIEQMRRKVY
jgi:ATP/maltotriose-dependent transcriptional regulator MalT